ncbi:MAG: phenylalanine--tRNA ligase subunit alpha [Cyanobacteria bacterium]|nr:phenylalanine--tRNA ligase subunit alpha [Cyanobacteriota bacterium]MDA1021532.1 phenylalanine--tRNA ligase subunit alpha [Cyanobacteriota bacterium]
MELTLKDTREELSKLEAEAASEFPRANDSKTLNDIRVKYLGDKSTIVNLRRNMKHVSNEEKPEFGKLINQTLNVIQTSFETAKTRIETAELNAKLEKERIDPSLPGLGTKLGNLHPLTMVTNDIVKIFETMGFSLVDGPEIENTYYNFTALNTPEDHPARDEQDTFYTSLGDDVLLRSHTSSIQIRAMERLKPPFRIIGHGRVYRNEEVNARKMPFFHQLEVMMIEENVNFGNMKWVLNEFLKQFFGEELPTRFRPDFFPFTEPSAELDAQCVFCKGNGCTTCGNRGWLELMGCGMVDPKVLEMAGIDPEKYSGFAAGLGIDRFAMLKYKINDIRFMFNGDQRFLNQF